jgi:exopolysaccharide biosynthesis polyprenyl glycosylphosphotransferase
MTERAAEDLLRTLPAPFYHGGASTSHGTASIVTVRRSRRGRTLALFGVTLLASDSCLWLLSLIGISFSLPSLASLPRIPTPSVITLPLLCLAGVLYSISAYNSKTDMLSLEFTSTYLIGIVTALCLSLAAVYFLGTFGSENQPRRLMIPLAFVVFAPAALLVRRLLFGRIARLAETKGALLVIGSGEDAIEFYRSYRRINERHAIRFIDPCIDSNTPFSLDGPGSPAFDPHWERRINRVGSRYDAVILARAPSELPIELTERLIDIHFHQTPVFTVDAFFECNWRRVYLRGVSPEWLFQEGFHLTRRSATSHLKRLIDIAVSAVALTALLPLLSLIAVVIRLEDRGRAIFRQSRVGLRGRVFTIFKFRTMREAPEGDLYTRTGDHRVTRFGAFLRRSRLDELPQLWNVLRGDMSLIGPRAEWTKCAEIYEKEIPNYHLRHLVRPGITGWAQINYPYGENLQDAIEKLRFDLYYIRYFSLLLDWSTMLKTIHVMLFGKGR